MNHIVRICSGGHGTERICQFASHSWANITYAAHCDRCHDTTLVTTLGTTCVKFLSHPLADVITDPLPAPPTQQHLVTMPMLFPHGTEQGEERSGDDASSVGSGSSKGGAQSQSGGKKRKVYRKKMADLAKFWESAQWYVDLWMSSLYSILCTVVVFFSFFFKLNNSARKTQVIT